MLKITKTIRKRMDQIIMGACVVLFAFMVVIGSYQIITR